MLLRAAQDGDLGGECLKSGGVFKDHPRAFRNSSSSSPSAAWSDGNSSLLPPPAFKVLICWRRALL